MHAEFEVKNNQEEQSLDGMMLLNEILMEKIVRYRVD
jgi:hypothetical protein